MRMPRRYRARHVYEWLEERKDLDLPLEGLPLLASHSQNISAKMSDSVESTQDQQHVDSDQRFSDSDSSEDFGGDPRTSDLDFGDESDDADGAHEGAANQNASSYTDVSTYPSFKEALLGKQAANAFVYTYLTRYQSRRRHARIYACRSHVACEHRMKITSLNQGDDNFVYVLAEAGQHAHQATGVTRRGIHPEIIGEVDDLLMVGWSGGELRTLLQLRFRNDPEALLVLPSTRQLTNRKAYLTTHAIGGWDIQDFATFNAWASTRMCTTRETFEEVTDLADPRMDELIVLDTFNFASDDGVSPPTFGVVVSSRRVLRNIATSVRDQGRELVCSTDGTYKLDFGGWTLVAFGTIRTRWARQAHTQEFVPWVYTFVRSESSRAYLRTFTVARTTAQLFLGVELDVVYATLDHSEAIALAFEQAWPQVRLLTCWPHVARQTRKKRSLLTDVELYDTVIKPNIDILQAARSHGQFLRMANIITSHWVKIGEREYANWFRAVYLTRRWDRWYINGADSPGVTPNQNPIEAHHRVVKRTCAPSRRASTSGVVTQILPRILKYDGDNLCPTTVSHVCGGPLIPEALAKAGRLVGNSSNYRYVYKGKGRHRQHIAILFNARKYINDAGNVVGSKVTPSRARRFTNSLAGEIADGITPAELRFELLSLHQVSIIGRLPSTAFDLPAVWNAEAIASVRSSLRCTCKAYVRSGWVCSHILATLSLLQLLDLELALGRVPARRGPGRPPVRREALTAQRDEGYFGVDRLTNLFLRRPGQPMQWRVLDDFDVVIGGVTETSNFGGVVVGFRMTEGAWSWTVHFDQGDYRDYGAEELAEAVNRAHIAGVRVTA